VHGFCRSAGRISDTAKRGIEDAVRSEEFPSRACSADLDARMTAAIKKAGSEGDSIGGTVECITEGLPIGFGGIWFEALDSEIARAVFSIPACKGVEFGKGFSLTRMTGSQSNDGYRYGRDGNIVTESNNMGGIVGGMSNGAPMVFRTAFKPTPTISKTQHTVDLITGKDTDLSAEGRHDPCIAPRAVAAVEAVTALIIADQMVRGY